MIFRRLLWHLNRSPAARVTKFAMRALHRRDLAMRRDLARQLPVSPEALAVAENVRRQGYSDATDLLPVAAREALSAAVAEAAQVSPSNAATVFKTNKEFWVHLLDNQMVDGSLPASSPFARFAMDPSLLGALARIYGEIPRLDYVAVTHSLPSEAELRYSQLWHRDHDDTKVIKLFVYLTDVGDDDGPFTFIPGPVSDAAGFAWRSHRSDAAIGKVVDLSQAVSMKGPRLTAFLVQTSRCFHMGSRVKPGHSRLMYTATYISAPRIYPERPKPFFSADGVANPLEHALLAY